MSISFHNSYYSLGCPVWNCPAWRGSVYRSKAPKEKWLSQYTQLFGTVEGNSTFYGIPSPDTFRRWGEQATEGFRFSLKFPRSVSHDSQLVDAEVDTENFLAGLKILDESGKLGPTFLQLGPNFGSRNFRALESYLRRLPKEYSFAVEVRNAVYFEQGLEVDLNQILRELKMDRVIFDTRPLHSAPATDEFEKKSQIRKPKIPIRYATTSTHPMLRLVGRNQVERVEPWIDEWAEVVAQWIAEGLHPYVFLHAPDDSFAPQLARMFHNKLCQLVEGIEEITQWPNYSTVQKTLFS